jgi:aminoglycoside phosphotransferase (APT) family kinase protein
MSHTNRHWSGFPSRHNRVIRSFNAARQPYSSDMSGDITGRPVNAVLVPPQAERFASLVGVDLGRLVLNVTGWNKLVLLDADRVFLFPRAADGLEWFERELSAYRALANTELRVVPRLLGRWEDPEIYRFPFAAVTRLRGAVPAEPEALIDQLGAAIARWHELEPPPLPGARPPRHHDAAHHRWLRRALNPATSAGAAAEAATRLGRPERTAAWAKLLGSAARHAPVLVHGDIHEDQLLADGDRLTGIIDWETVRVDHPFWDLDLGQWGTGLWRRRDFSALWARVWRVYAQARGLDTDSGPLETAFRLRHALALRADPGDPAVLGTLEEQLAHL